MEHQQEHIFIDPAPPLAFLESLDAGQVCDWGITAIGAPAAWKVTKGRGIQVAVLDTGSAPHPDLEGAVISRRAVVDTDDCFDNQGHGTHCTGIIGARDNTIGVIGVAPDCAIRSIKVLKDHGGATFHEIAGGIRQATADDVDIISMSLGTRSRPPDGELQDSILEACAKGIVIVAAAGNEYNPKNPDTINYPANCEGVIPVAAVDQKWARAPFSSTGPGLDHGIAMPGVEIYSTWLNNGYARLSGTSMATPMLAGFIALCLAYHAEGEHSTPIAKKGNPQRVQDVIGHLQRYVRPLGDGCSFGIGTIDGSRLGLDGD